MTTLRARFDGKHFLPEGALSLPAGRTYLLHVEDVDLDEAGKIASLREAMQDPLFLQDLEEVAGDFTAVDAED
jgi:hypothetical protein